MDFAGIEIHGIERERGMLILFFEGQFKGLPSSFVGKSFTGKRVGDGIRDAELGTAELGTGLIYCDSLKN